MKVLALLIVVAVVCVAIEARPRAQGPYNDREPGSLSNMYLQINELVKPENIEEYLSDPDTMFVK